MPSGAANATCKIATPVPVPDDGDADLQESCAAPLNATAAMRSRVGSAWTSEKACVKTISILTFFASGLLRIWVVFQWNVYVGVLFCMHSPKRTC